MTTAQKKNVTIGSIVAGGVLASALLGFAGFETKAAHSQDIQSVKAEHSKEYDRLICIAESIQLQLDNKRSKVCP